MLSVNPDAASRQDVARMAAELMEARHMLDEMLEGSDIIAEAAVFVSTAEEIDMGKMRRATTEL